MPNAETENAVTRAILDGHLKQDEERFQRIDRGINHIGDVLTTFMTKLDAQAQRIHSRIDEEAAAARKAVADAAAQAREDNQNAVTIARAEAKVAMSVAKDANESVLGTKIWVLTGAVAGLIAIITAAVNYLRH